jgi:hypothetical protein
MGQPGGSVNRHDGTSARRAVLVVVLALAGAAAAFVAAMPWLRAYQVEDAPVLLALAAALPVALSGAVTRWLRFGPLVAYAVSLTGLLALVAVANSFDWQAAWSGATQVPAQLLTETLPLGGGPYLLVGPMVVTWAGAAVSAELLLRPSRPAFAALAVPISCFVLAFAATTSAPEGTTAAQAAALLGALAVAGLARQALLQVEVEEAEMSAPANQAVSPGRGLRGLKARAGGRSNPAWKAAAAVALVGGLAAALAYVVPSVPQLAAKPAALDRPTQLLSGTVMDPVNALAALRSSTPRGHSHPMLKVEVNRPWPGYVALATLDQYDGGSWYFSSTFRPTGGRVPGGPSPGQPDKSAPGTVTISQRYMLLRSTGLPFLPAIDRPVQVEGLDADADPTTGMLATQAAPPLSYRVVSLAAQATAAQLPPASALATGQDVPGGDRPSYTTLPPGAAKDVAAAVRYAVNLTGLPASPSFAFLQDLAAALRAHERRLSLAPRKPRPLAVAGPGAVAQPVPAPLAGTSLAQVINAVTVNHAATPEQFATFFAAVARYLGVPVRLVTGFRAPAAARATAPLPAGWYKLTNKDAWAWDELPVVGYGWVVVDSTPLLTTSRVSAPPEEVKPAPPAKAHQATALPGNRAAHALAKPVKVAPKAVLAVNWGLLLGTALPACLLLALAGGFLGVPGLRRRLRRLARHRPEDPALLAAGAWLELLDGLTRLGAGVPTAATSTDVLREVQARFGDGAMEPARVVASVADQALYCTRWPVDDDRARLAWNCQHQLYQYMRRSVGRRCRARSLLLVGSAPARPGAIVRGS